MQKNINTILNSFSQTTDNQLSPAVFDGYLGWLWGPSLIQSKSS